MHQSSSKVVTVWRFVGEDIAGPLPCMPRGCLYLLATTGRPSGEELPQTSPEVVAALQQQMEATRQVSSNLRLAGQAMTHLYQPHGRNVKNAVKDRVCLYNLREERGLAPMLQSKWESPCTVLERHSSIICKLGNGTRKRPRIVHVDCM